MLPKSFAPVGNFLKFILKKFLRRSKELGEISLKTYFSPGFGRTKLGNGPPQVTSDRATSAQPALRQRAATAYKFQPSRRSSRGDPSQLTHPRYSRTNRHKCLFGKIIVGIASARSIQKHLSRHPARHFKIFEPGGQGEPIAVPDENIPTSSRQGNLLDRNLI